MSFITLFSFSNLPGPKVNCVSVLPNGNIQIFWETILDPTNIFVSYEVFLVSGASSTSLQTINNINQTNYIHITTASNNVSQQYIIATNTNVPTSNNSDTVSSIKLSVNNPSNGMAILNWNPIFSPLNNSTASNWYLIHREFPAGTWTLIDSTQYGNEYYRDTITICADSVNYRITNNNGTCTSTSNIDGKNFNDVIPPYSPVIKSVTVDTSNNLGTITWFPTRPNDTRGYIILKNITGSWVPIDTVIGINNTTYQYSASTAGTESECFGIAAFDSCFYGSPLRPNTSAMGLPHCSVFATQSYTACDKTISLSWDSYSGWTSGINKYEIFYKINGGNDILAGTTTTNNFTLSNVKPDSLYCISIRAISGNFADTSLSNKICLSTTYPYVSDTNYLQTVTVLNANSIQLKIFTTPSNTIKGYNIYKSNDNGNTFNQIGFAPNNSSPISFVDNTSVFTETINYQYKAIAIDSCNNLTSNETNIGETVLLTTSLNQTDYTTTLNWNPYQVWNGNVKEYNIYRKLGSSTPVLIATVPASTFSYSDDISNFYSSSEDGKFCYYIEAAENTNNFAISETSNSNTSCVTPKHILYIPNSFTPNHDGQNDVFLPVIGFANLTTYTLRIFNRLGQEIFVSNDIRNGWDGTHRNKLVSTGIYIYSISIQNSEGKPFNESGSVLLLK